MRLHPRELIVREAEIEFNDALSALEKKDGPTYADLYALLASLFVQPLKIIPARFLFVEERWLPLVKKYELTEGECARIVGSAISSLAKYEIRGERHPNDPNKPGGVA